MCGIIGFKGSAKDSIDITVAMELLGHRGDDSFGCIHISPSIRKGHTKKTMKIKDLAEWFKSIPKVDDDFFLFHNRKASIGGINLPLCHPITEGRVSVIHNGTKASLQTNFKSLGGASDTETITKILSTSFNTGVLTKRMLNNTGVVFAQQHSGGLLFHTDNGRPLFINKDRDIICSEPIFIDEWSLTVDQTKIWKGFNDMVANVEVFKESVVVTDGSSELNYCYSCGKMHYMDEKDYICYSCNIQGLDDYTYGYSRGGYAGKRGAKSKKSGTTSNFKFKVGQKYKLRDGSTFIVSEIRNDRGSYPIIGKVTDIKGVTAKTTDCWGSAGNYASATYGNPKDIISLVDTSKKTKQKSKTTTLDIVTSLASQFENGKYYLFSNDSKNWIMAKLLDNTKMGKHSFKIETTYGSRYCSFARKATAIETNVLNNASKTYKIGTTCEFTNIKDSNCIITKLENLGITEGKLKFYARYIPDNYSFCNNTKEDTINNGKPKIGKEYLFSNNGDSWYLGTWGGTMRGSDYMVTRLDYVVPYKFFKKFDMEEKSC